MNTTQMNAAAEKARERLADANDRGTVALRALTEARAGLTAAEGRREGCMAALNALADAEMAGTPASVAQVSQAVLAVETAGREVTWREAVLRAAQRALQAAQAEATAAQAAVDTAVETARKAALHARVLELAGGR